MQFTVSTVVPTGCSTTMVALVNPRWVMFSLEFGFGQSGAPGIGESGSFVSTSKATFPFWIAPSGIASLPVTVIGAGF